MLAVLKIFFQSLFAHTEVLICSAVLGVCLIWFLLFLAARHEQLKICKANLDAVNAELLLQPDGVELYLERAFILTQLELPLSGLSDLEKAFELGCSAESLKTPFLQCYWNIPIPRASTMTPWSKCEHAAPKLCAELHREDPTSYAPKFLMVPERFGIVERVRKVEQRRPKIS